MYYAYILKCADGSYYVGHAEAIEERVSAHNAGRGAVYTRERRPVTLVYSEVLPSLSAAMARERQIKGWSTSKKSALIRGDLDALRRLSH